VGFFEEDFAIFKKADGDSCRACMSGEVGGRKVTEEEFHDYLDAFVERDISGKFKRLWALIDGALAHPAIKDLDINLKFREQPKSQMPKLRPIFYAILTHSGIGQNRAQLNLRLSYDKRPNDKDRRRKFGVKFSLHHKCKKDLPNKDMELFAKNIRDKSKTFIKLLKSLDNDFVVFKNYGYGIDADYIVANELEQNEINDLFLAIQGSEIHFQEIHKSFYWDSDEDRQIIQDETKLAAECLKTILKLYPLYLFATVDDPGSLRAKLNSFIKPPKSLKQVLRSSRIESLSSTTLEIEDGKQIHPREIFAPYVSSAKSIIIGDNWLPFNEQLRRTVISFCSLVRNKSQCNIELVTQSWRKYHPDQRKGVNQTQFGLILDKLVKDIVNLGFDNNQCSVSYDNMRDRILETDLWKIESSHPLDFYYSNWKAKRNNFRFVPKTKVAFKY
jgi:hypothetical protein